jgi:predicted metalloendopeptidase
MLVCCIDVIHEISEVSCKFCYCYRYPDKWIDYTPFTIEKDDTFLEIVFKAREFDNTIEIKEMNGPTDKQKWVRNHAATMPMLS